MRPDLYRECLDKLHDLYRDEVYRQFEAAICDFDKQLSCASNTEAELAMFDGVD